MARGQRYDRRTGTFRFLAPAPLRSSLRSPARILCLAFTLAFLPAAGVSGEFCTPGQDEKWSPESIAVTSAKLFCIYEGNRRAAGCADDETSPEAPSMAKPRIPAREYADLPFGYCGPLGPFGPLGAKGPLGPLDPKRSLSPFTVESRMRFYSPAFAFWWHLALSELTGLESVFDDGSAVGPYGPLGHKYCEVGAFRFSSPFDPDFSKNLQAGGKWAALGPLGPLGAMGPLGPLGPLGLPARDGWNSTGTPDKIPGAYYDYSGNRHPSKSLKGGDGVERAYELVEFYPEDVVEVGLAGSHPFPAGMADTSFFVDGELEGTEIDRYHFASSVPRYVTITVTPGNPNDGYGLRLMLSNPTVLGGTTVTSMVSQWTYINMIHVRVPANTQFDREVTRNAPLGEQRPPCFWEKPPYWGWPIAQAVLSIADGEARGMYRLTVVGSPEYIDGSDIHGSHQIPLPHLSTHSDIPALDPHKTKKVAIKAE